MCSYKFTWIMFDLHILSHVPHAYVDADPDGNVDADVDAAQQYLRYSRSGYSRLYNTEHAGGCTALSLPSICFFLAHTLLALLQIRALTEDEEVLIVERRDDEEYRHFVRSHHLEKMRSEGFA